MPKFAANLTMLFNEALFLERFKAAADAGFDAVEFLFPYPYAPDALAERLDAHRLRLVLHNLPAGDWERGERGIACLPDRVGEFQDGVGRAIDYARALNVPQLNCLVGIAPADQRRDTTLATIVENLRFAAAELKKAGLRLLVEPCNGYDLPGFALQRSADALDVIRAVGADNLFLQYDIYHMQRMEGELAATLRRHIGAIAHIQLADNPGRHEPGTGEIHYPYLFALLDELGYDGYIGCEYKPRTTTAGGLGWLDEARRAGAGRARHIG
ncbi:hydroxypyruvate isomerase [Burkholderia sp. TSV86]|uniref:hydroxypyruvate isomerase n=1 Tax=Burkholderia sp. TSV86 TaxID=1385594 RepID=UPI000756D6FF|nr:hydroxypyruvate isomerase [Burkholderia sp. TSV86]KVE33044.1 hydroxypyruvate isomerase [Burkholderia sp. TSV86]